jgi:1-acyl-sn-glycerol-3-phosphate acyltransferase
VIGRTEAVSRLRSAAPTGARRLRAATQTRLHAGAVRSLLRFLFRLFFRIKVHGLRNIPSTPAIICANHLGWADPFLVLLFFPVDSRIYVLGLHPAALSRFRALVVDTLQVIVALDPNRPLEALRACKEVVEQGSSVLIFPEGTAVGGEEGTLGELHDGAAYLSVMTGAPLLPVGLTGTKELWLRRTLTMRIGRAIYPHALEGNNRTRTHGLTSRVGAELRALLPGDTERARFKPLKKWLTRLFF